MNALYQEAINVTLQGLGHTGIGKNLPPLLRLTL